MSMSTFLYAADALRVEDGIEWTLTPPAGQKAPPRADVGAKNAQSMQALQGMMGGLGKKKGALL